MNLMTSKMPFEDLQPNQPTGLGGADEHYHIRTNNASTPVQRPRDDDDDHARRPNHGGGGGGDGGPATPLQNRRPSSATSECRHPVRRTHHNTQKAKLPNAATGFLTARRSTSTTTTTVSNAKHPPRKSSRVEESFPRPHPQSSDDDDVKVDPASNDFAGGRMLRSRPTPLNAWHDGSNSNQNHFGIQHQASSVSSVERRFAGIELGRSQSPPMSSVSPTIRGHAWPPPHAAGSQGFGMTQRSSFMTEASNATAGTTFSQAMARRINTEFEEVENLGSGNFGEVILVKDRTTRERFAVKRSGVLHSGHDTSRALQERNILGALRCKSKHLVTMFASWLEPQHRPQLYIQLEYCPYGTLSELMAYRRHTNHCWAEVEVLSLLTQMACALVTMHAARIAHVDVKPDNILLNDELQYVLADFGCAQFLDEQTGRPVTSSAASAGNNQKRRGVGQTALSMLNATGNGPRHRSQTAQQLFSPCDAGVSNRASGMVLDFSQRSEASQRGDSVMGTQQNWGSVSQPQAPGAMMTSFINPVGNGMGERSYSMAQSVDLVSVDEGDCRYVAFDMLNEKRHFTAGDVFSLGMSILEVMSGEPLPRERQFRHSPDSLPELEARGYSKRLVQLVCAMIAVEPTARPTAFQLVQHELLRPSHAAVNAVASAEAPSQGAHTNVNLEVLRYGSFDDPSVAHQHGAMGSRANSVHTPPGAVHQSMMSPPIHPEVQPTTPGASPLPRKMTSSFGQSGSSPDDSSSPRVQPPVFGAEPPAAKRNVICASQALADGGFAAAQLYAASLEAAHAVLRVSRPAPAMQEYRQ
jgi:serine/threonine protein kinase